MFNWLWRGGKSGKGHSYLKEPDVPTFNEVEQRIIDGFAKDSKSVIVRVRDKNIADCPPELQFLNGEEEANFDTLPIYPGNALPIYNGIGLHWTDECGSSQIAFISSSSELWVWLTADKWFTIPTNYWFVDIFDTPARERDTLARERAEKALVERIYEKLNIGKDCLKDNTNV